MPTLITTTTTPLYEVIVSNIGRVYSGHDEEDAKGWYEEYVALHCSPHSRCRGAEVTLWEDDEPVKSFDSFPGLFPEDEPEDEPEATPPD